jgi:hypothetical protein
VFIAESLVSSGAVRCLYCISSFNNGKPYIFARPTARRAALPSGVLAKLILSVYSLSICHVRGALSLTDWGSTPSLRKVVDNFRAGKFGAYTARISTFKPVARTHPPKLNQYSHSRVLTQFHNKNQYNLNQQWNIR